MGLLNRLFPVEFESVLFA